ncbi:hypothetical protein MJO28_011943 [Puccinia striiformis f. sp. tritici]|uniref:Uncharacterized protein n=1 Tax=Puccinia striiformis f. sp. tritici TaxID=168172 RepID=A0ACC0DZ34_9BASI|nr:hypothetical protein MJO28_011943 [Puccinia striiformis f. sp. tritici]KAI7946165.1 hypothetical protein MJO29_012553 [Puccinia striiformis f. sp. tritici]
MDDSSQLIKGQGNLVVNGFERLIQKCNTPSDSEYDQILGQISNSRTLPINMEKDLFNHLHSRLLPLLEQQITYLSSLLDPTELKSQPRQMLGLILEIQPELGRTLDQIQMELKTNCLIRSTISISKNTKNLEKMVYTGPSNLPLQKGTKLRFKVPQGRKYVIDQTTYSCREIKHTIRWLEGSKLDLVQYQWPDQITDLDGFLTDLLSLINPPTNPTDRDIQLSQLGRMPAQPLSIQARILCAWSVPIIKLSELLTLLKKYDDENENEGEDEDEDEDQVDQANVTSQDSKRVTASLKTCLQGYLLTVVLYFVLLIPQNINDHPYNQDYIRDWFTTWNNHFSIAICTLEGDAQSFDDHH